jgi:hypothetical protein
MSTVAPPLLRQAVFSTYNLRRINYFGFMNIEDLSQLPLGTEIMVANESFTHIGYLTVVLEGGDETRWMKGESEDLLIVNPQTEEVRLLHPILEEIDPEAEHVMFRSEQYTFSYEDEGVVDDLEGDVLSDPEDEYHIYEYESDDGDLVFLVHNETTDEMEAYAGKPVFVDDIYEV